MVCYQFIEIAQLKKKSVIFFYILFACKCFCKWVRGSGGLHQLTHDWNCKTHQDHYRNICFCSAAVQCSAGPHWPYFTYLFSCSVFIIYCGICVRIRLFHRNNYSSCQILRISLFILTHADVALIWNTKNIINSSHSFSLPCESLFPMGIQYISLEKPVTGVQRGV